MKNLLALTILLFAGVACASGKITVQDNAYENGKVHRPMVAFGVYQNLKDVLPMGKHLALNLWTGYGVQPLEVKDDVNWLVAKGQLDVIFSKVTVGMGVQYKDIIGEDVQDVIPYLKVDYKLW